MCGICGVRRFGPEPITKDQIDILLCSNEHRGNHATGIAIQDAETGDVRVLKQDVPAWKFTSSVEYTNFLEEHLKPETMLVLGHTRQATQGSPTEQENNHPVFAGKVAVTHNGMISNDNYLFKDLKLKREAEVDSDIIRAILDEEGLTRKGIATLKKISGSMAIAAISSEQPGILLLGRTGSPLVLASTANQLVWSSEKMAIHSAMRPITWRFGFPMQPNRTDLAFMTVNNDSIYIIGDLAEKVIDGETIPSALRWHENFAQAKHYVKPNYRVNETYTAHKDKFYQGKEDTPGTLLASSTDPKPHMAYCKACSDKKGKSIFLDVSEFRGKKELWELECKECKTLLAQPPVSIVPGTKLIEGRI